MYVNHSVAGHVDYQTAPYLDIMRFRGQVSLLYHFGICY